MGKSNKKKGAEDNGVDEQVAASSDVSKVVIMEAAIKDDFCNYKYEFVGGHFDGFVPNVNGKGIIDEDLRNAFLKLNVHLAVADDIFKHSDVAIKSISSMHKHELAQLYFVTGFKMKGGEDNECIVLIGTKFLSTGSRMSLESPKIPIDPSSSYKWYNELKQAADDCRHEVMAYHEGKFTNVEKDEEEEPVLKQTKMKFDSGADKFDTEE